MLRFHFGFAVLLTCLPPVANFWFFSCRHGNGNGVVGDFCSVFCQCRSPNSCEAGVQRCVSPGRLDDPCHVTRPCREGLSCHPGVQRCYHVPRRVHEPCVAGFECGNGLSCQPGVQVCFHASRRYNEPCVSGYPCGPGLSCQPGAQRCLHFPRRENERCSLGFECGAGLGCTLCAEPYLTCQMDRVPDVEEEFYRRPYNKVAFLVTHNAFSNDIEYAVWVRNQRVSVAQQLRDGVRGLMLDIYPGWGIADVRLCHASCFWGGSSNLLDTLVQIRKFLRKNPREVVTLIFEDYLKNPTILRRVFDQARISGHVFRSRYWGSKYKDWPTLNEMRSLGRLVVFNNNGLDGFPYTSYNMWYWVRENRYGQEGLDTKTCEDRAESKYNAHYNDNWSLVLINWFGTATNPLNPCLNSYTKMKLKLTTCERVFGQRANFIAVDYYQAGEKGGAFKASDWLNKQWKEQFDAEINFNFAVQGAYTYDGSNTTNHVTNTTSDNHVTNTTSDNHVTNTTRDHHVTNITRINHMTNTTSGDHVTNTTSANHVTNNTRNNHVTNNTSANHVTNNTRNNHVTNNTSGDHVTNITSANHVTNNTRNNYVTNNTSDNHVTNSTNDNHVTNSTNDNHVAHVANTTDFLRNTTNHATDSMVDTNVKHLVTNTTNHVTITPELLAFATDSVTNTTDHVSNTSRENQFSPVTNNKTAYLMGSFDEGKINRTNRTMSIYNTMKTKKERQQMANVTTYILPNTNVTNMSKEYKHLNLTRDNSTNEIESIINTNTTRDNKELEEELKKRKWDIPKEKNGTQSLEEIIDNM